MMVAKSVLVPNILRGRQITQVTLRGLFCTPYARIKVGDKLPSVDLYENLPVNKVNTGQLTDNKKIIFFGVPGAFTPGCSRTHLPGFVNDAETLKAKHGADDIVCIAMNDPFVMGAWGRQQKCAGKVRMLADPTGAFTRALNLGIDLPPLGGVRTKRFSMIVDKGTVKELNVEPDGTSLTVSLASNVGSSTAYPYTRPAGPPPSEKPPSKESKPAATPVSVPDMDESMKKAFDMEIPPEPKKPYTPPPTGPKSAPSKGDRTEKAIDQSQQISNKPNTHSIKHGVGETSPLATPKADAINATNVHSPPGVSFPILPPETQSSPDIETDQKHEEREIDEGHMDERNPTITETEDHSRSPHN